MHPFHQVTNQLSCDVDPIDHLDEGFLARARTTAPVRQYFPVFQLAELAPEVPRGRPPSNIEIERRLINALQIQHDRPERHDRHEKPLIVPEWIGHVCEMEPGCGVKSQDVSDPQ
jgi:hypothetical protein